jgi:hypothetical protein
MKFGRYNTTSKNPYDKFSISETFAYNEAYFQSYMENTNELYGVLSEAVEYRIINEGKIADVAKTIFDKIKAMFKAFIDALKSVWEKITGFFNKKKDQKTEEFVKEMKNKSDVDVVKSSDASETKEESPSTKPEEKESEQKENEKEPEPEEKTSNTTTSSASQEEIKPDVEKYALAIKSRILVGDRVFKGWINTNKVMDYVLPTSSVNFLDKLNYCGMNLRYDDIFEGKSARFKGSYKTDTSKDRFGDSYFELYLEKIEETKQTMFPGAVIDGTSGGFKYFGTKTDFETFKEKMNNFDKEVPEKKDITALDIYKNIDAYIDPIEEFQQDQEKKFKVILKIVTDVSNQITQVSNSMESQLSKINPDSDDSRRYKEYIKILSGCSVICSQTLSGYNMAYKKMIQWVRYHAIQTDHVKAFYASCWK